jgi:hypothetical protein
MGKRSQPRKPVKVPVRIFGTDRNGQVFSEKVFTVNISRTGAELADVRPELNVEEIIGLTYGNYRVHFRVKWIGKPGTPKAGRVGLLNLTPDKPLWDLLLYPDAPDNFQPGNVERRKTPRFRCQNSIEIHVHQGASFWGTVADLGLGGCYVEMPIPLEPGTKVRVGIWFGQTKAWAEAEVAHRSPGLGIGLKFTAISDQDLDEIRRFLGSLAPLARKPMVAVQSGPLQTKT